MQKNNNKDSFAQRINFTVEVPFNPIEWRNNECTHCLERHICFNRNNKSLREKRISQVIRIGHCEDYDFDHSSIVRDPFQAAEEDRTFDRCWEDREFPI
jgi:hypothetical protein